jgi:hypothetical protein
VDLEGAWYLQARAVIAHRFHAYTFEVLDATPFEEVVELQVAAEWLGEQEAKATRATSRPSRRKR